MSGLLFPQLSKDILGMAFEVHSKLGPGLLEKVYERAMMVELSLAGYFFEKQKAFPVIYKGFSIGHYVADLIVENKFILELKAVQEMTAVHSAQIINYLKLSKVPVGYLLNFYTPRLSWKRFVCSECPP